MAVNFYSDNPDIRFQLQNQGLEESVKLKEQEFRQKEQFPDAPEDFADALDSYDKVLAMVGEICGFK